MPPATVLTYLDIKIILNNYYHLLATIINVKACGERRMDRYMFVSLSYKNNSRHWMKFLTHIDYSLL